MSVAIVSRWFVAAVVVSAVGVYGYTLGSHAETPRPAVAAGTERRPVEPPKISDPGFRTAPAAGTGRDALTPDEVTRARALAVDAGLRSQTADVTGAGGPEVLSVQLDGDGASPQDVRQAAVLLYDYRSDRLLKRVVDLAAGRVDGTFAARRRQPPPTERETGAAVELLWRDEAAAVLRERFQASTGTPLTSRDQLTFEAQTFSADDGDRGPAAACGVHRCLVLLPRPADRPFLDLTDLVVDLSARAVVRAGD